MNFDELLGPTGVYELYEESGMDVRPYLMTK